MHTSAGAAAVLVRMLTRVPTPRLARNAVGGMVGVSALIALPSGLTFLLSNDPSLNVTVGLRALGGLIAAGGTALSAMAVRQFRAGLFVCAACLVVRGTMRTRRVPVNDVVVLRVTDVVGVNGVIPFLAVEVVRASGPPLVARDSAYFRFQRRKGDEAVFQTNQALGR